MKAWKPDPSLPKAGRQLLAEAHHHLPPQRLPESTPHQLADTIECVYYSRIHAAHIHSNTRFLESMMQRAKILITDKLSSMPYFDAD